MIKGFLFYDNKRIVKVSLKRKKNHKFEVKLQRLMFKTKLLIVMHLTMMT